MFKFPMNFYFIHQYQFIAIHRVQSKPGNQCTCNPFQKRALSTSCYHILRNPTKDFIKEIRTRLDSSFLLNIFIEKQDWVNPISFLSQQVMRDQDNLPFFNPSNSGSSRSEDGAPLEIIVMELGIHILLLLPHDLSILNF